MWPWDRGNGERFDGALEHSGSHQKLVGRVRELEEHARELEGRLQRLESSWGIRLATWLGLGWKGGALAFGSLAALAGLVYVLEGLHGYLDAHGVPHPTWLP